MHCACTRVQERDGHLRPVCSTSSRLWMTNEGQIYIYGQYKAHIHVHTLAQFMPLIAANVQTPCYKQTQLSYTFSSPAPTYKYKCLLTYTQAQLVPLVAASAQHVQQTAASVQTFYYEHIYLIHSLPPPTNKHTHAYKFIITHTCRPSWYPL